ncbi:MAG: hypothetical protein ACYS0I_12125 [Planctomycetota bacterium]|jgi:hypothetical protein
MKYYLAAALVISVAFITLTSCLQHSQQSHTSIKPSLPAPTNLPKALDMPKNNSLCILCHLDFDDEPITTDHLSNAITCAHCHGTSVAHMHDETMMTSPDVLYGRSQVNPMCNNCHKPHKFPRAVENFRKKWLGKKRENGRSIIEDSICTDCHGLHTIARR